MKNQLVEDARSMTSAQAYLDAVRLYPTARVSVWCVSAPRQVEVINDLVTYWPTTDSIYKHLKRVTLGGTYVWSIREAVWVAEGKGDEPAEEVPGREITRGVINLPIELGLPVAVVELVGRDLGVCGWDELMQELST